MTSYSLLNSTTTFKANPRLRLNVKLRKMMSFLHHVILKSKIFLEKSSPKMQEIAFEELWIYNGHIAPPPNWQRHCISQWFIYINFEVIFLALIALCHLLMCSAFYITAEHEPFHHTPLLAKSFLFGP